MFGDALDGLELPKTVRQPLGDVAKYRGWALWAITSVILLLCTRARESLVVFGTRVLQGFSVIAASLHTQSVGKSEPRRRDSYHIEQQRLEAHHHRATPKGRGMHAPTRDEIVDDEWHDKNICGEE